MDVESLRWREVEWRRIPPPMRLHTMHYLTAHDTVNLDTAVAEKEERKHLVKAYVGLRSAGLDGYTYRLKWVSNKVVGSRV